MLCQDHNHGNGLCRGQLCNNCNAGLGFLGDNPDRMRKAARYVEDWRRAHAEEPDRSPIYGGPTYDPDRARARRGADRERKARRARYQLQAQALRAALKGWTARSKGSTARARVWSAIRVLESRASR